MWCQLREHDKCRAQKQKVQGGKVADDSLVERPSGACQNTNNNDTIVTDISNTADSLAATRKIQSPDDLTTNQINASTTMLYNQILPYYHPSNYSSLSCYPTKKLKGISQTTIKPRSETAVSTTSDSKLDDIQNTITRITASTIAPDTVDGTDNQTNSNQESASEVSPVDIPTDVSNTVENTARNNSDVKNEDELRSENIKASSESPHYLNNNDSNTEIVGDSWASSITHESSKRESLSNPLYNSAASTTASSESYRDQYQYYSQQYYASMQHAYINSENSASSNYVNPCNFYNTQMYPSSSLYPSADGSREHNGKMLPINSNSANDSNGSGELVPVNGSSNSSINSSYYSVYGTSTTHLPVNNANSSAVGVSSCYSSYSSNYGTQQLYPAQVIVDTISFLAF